MTEWSVVPALEAATFQAVHLEMRDSYGADDADFEDWRAGKPFSPDRMSWWYDLTGRAAARGVLLRRARIVSMPASEYIRFEHEITPHNIAAGEQVRWLPRRDASDLAVPGNDFWLFDDDLVIYNHFDGDGQWADEPEELRREPAVAQLCARAFEAVWARATPHADFRI